jgi:hypothetical protein
VVHLLPHGSWVGMVGGVGAAGSAVGVAHQLRGPGGNLPYPPPSPLGPSA